MARPELVGATSIIGLASLIVVVQKRVEVLYVLVAIRLAISRSAILISRATSGFAGRKDCARLVRPWTSSSLNSLHRLWIGWLRNLPGLYTSTHTLLQLPKVINRSSLQGLEKRALTQQAMFIQYLLFTAEVHKPRWVSLFRQWGIKIRCTKLRFELRKFLGQIQRIAYVPGLGGL